ncbi:MAG: hypothetical protein M3Y37_11555, partial [Chloroflexota bacterium]|nr:hypothetical protein [Chloroflexota bacterium]
FMLVLVEFGFPARDVEWRGVHFSNHINSEGSRRIAAMFRERLDWMPGPNASNPLSVRDYLFGLRIAWGGMFVIQALALIACWRMRPISPWLWTIGPVATCLVLLLYPPTSTDIYAYASFGWVADMGGNPYTDPPETIPGDPFARYNDWTHITTPYGPIWTVLSHLFVHLSGGDPLVAALIFKGFTMLSAFALAWVVYLLAGRFTDDLRLRTIALIIVLWSPILLTESTATVHLDPFMMLFALAGLLVATGTRFQSFRGGLLLVTASTLVKPATLPILGLLGLMRFIRPEPMRSVLGRVALDVAAVVGMMAVAYAPYLEGDFVSSVNKMAHDVFLDRPMRSNPLWAWALSHIDGQLGLSDHLPGNAGSFSRTAVIIIVLIVAVIVTRHILRERRIALAGGTEGLDHATLRFQIWAWAVTLAVLGILPLNGHAWYVIWCLGPMAILAVTDGHRIRTRPPVWLFALATWVTISFMIYHTLQKR